ncbi:MAG: hypothetical protein J6J42_04600 [Lachnospiraceae bacterium]|nr:hypothetical protein [Lachnospiraceae bacterium]
MMISPIGNSYAYYTASPYSSGATRGAARTAMEDMLHAGSTTVQPVDDVPEVFSNDEVDRVQRTPEELQQDRRDAYEIMNSLTPRNAEHLNAPLEFMTKSPFNGTEAVSGTKPSSEAEEALEKIFGDEEENADGTETCETCENRTYVDGSNENDVSFKTPGHISPEASAAQVSAHEYEHVRNAYQEDKEEGKELVSVSVSLKTAVCPECGKTYVAGGETRTIMRNGVEENPYAKQQQAYENFANGRTEQLNLAA